jgi:hypothetical protein
MTSRQDRRRRTPSPPGGKRDPDPDDLPPHLQERLQRLIPRLIELGMGCVHSAESEADGEEETSVDCGDRVSVCRAVCCSFRFALTEAEVARGDIGWEKEKPYFIAQGDDGYCTHHDGETMNCRIWEKRPLRCRRYDCRRESSFWEDADGNIIRNGTFDHLP